MVRIKDVAQRAGVSTTTVSNVLHGKTEKVSPEVAQRVSSLLREMGYVPSLGARLLVRRKSPIIGVAVDYAPQGELLTDHDRETAQAIALLEREISNWDHYMMLFNRHSPEKILQAGRAWKFTALVCFGLPQAQAEIICRGCEIPAAVISPVEGEALKDTISKALVDMLPKGED